MTLREFLTEPTINFFEAEIRRCLAEKNQVATLQSAWTWLNLAVANPSAVVAACQSESVRDDKQIHAFRDHLGRFIAQFGGFRELVELLTTAGVWPSTETTAPVSVSEFRCPRCGALGPFHYVEDVEAWRRVVQVSHDGARVLLQVQKAHHLDDQYGLDGANPRLRCQAKITKQQWCLHEIPLTEENADVDFIQERPRDPG